MPVMEGKAMLFKEFGGVDALPICLATKDADEIVADGQGDRAGLRRDQPRGHLGAALLRDREPAARGARHPGLPRRPARHRGRRARGVPERAAGRRQAAGGRQGRDDRRRRGRRRVHEDAARRRRAATSSAATAQGAIHRGRDGLDDDQALASPRARTRAGLRGTATRRSRAPTSSSGCPGPAPSRSTGCARWPTTRSSSRWRTRRPRCRPRRSRATSRSSRPAAPTTRTRSTTCSRSPASSAARSTCARARSTRR